MGNGRSKKKKTVTVTQLHLTHTHTFDFECMIYKTNALPCPPDRFPPRFPVEASIESTNEKEKEEEVSASSLRKYDNIPNASPTHWLREREREEGGRLCRSFVKRHLK